jgi:proteic killer suppression protein
MDITFATGKLAKTCNSEKKLNGEYGKEQALVIRQRLAELLAAETLAVMRTLPGHCHELKQNLKGLIAVSLIGKERLVFRPNHDPLPQLAAGGLDWAKVTKITIVGIGDYH